VPQATPYKRALAPEVRGGLGLFESQEHSDGAAVGFTCSTKTEQGVNVGRGKVAFQDRVA
jgi:hypothetical protein